ncbi:MAG: hypothetical protein EXR93_09690 [Gemmatimonadetes bacterium]|nr:hypothetical protein [Gemmatimonadota bacterium]
MGIFGTAPLLFTLCATLSPANPGAPAGGRKEPDWFSVDHKARTVSMKVVASQNPSHTAWAFNDHDHGNMTITVPEGYAITIEFTNDDYMKHSVGLVARPTGEMPTLPDATPVFPGAMSSNPNDQATDQGESETLRFTASKRGKYILICLIPSHAIAGMWVNFDVAAGQEAGVTTPT